MKRKAVTKNPRRNPSVVPDVPTDNQFELGRRHGAKSERAIIVRYIRNQVDWISGVSYTVARVLKLLADDISVGEHNKP